MNENAAATPLLAPAYIHWRPTLGDNDLLGWSITIGYMLAGLLCLCAARSEWRSSDRRVRPLFWLASALLIILLGVNTQLDLQLWLEEILRQRAERDGWIARRRAIQVVFLGITVGGSLTLAMLMLRHLRHTGRRYWFAVVALGIIAMFVVIRASEFVGLPYLKRLNRVHADWLKLGLELTGIVLLGLAAWRARQSAAPGDSATARQPAQDLQTDH